SGRNCSTPNSAISRGGQFTANSISTGPLVPCTPISSNASTISASGNRPCFSTGANVTSLTPAREMPSYTTSFSGEYVEPTDASVPSSSAAARSNRAGEKRPTLSVRPSSSARNSRWAFKSVSETDENWTMCRGYRGQNRKQGSPLTTVSPRPSATAAIPSSDCIGGSG